MGENDTQVNYAALETFGTSVADDVAQPFTSGLADPNGAAMAGSVAFGFDGTFTEQKALSTACRDAAQGWATKAFTEVQNQLLVLGMDAKTAKLQYEADDQAAAANAAAAGDGAAAVQF